MLKIKTQGKKRTVEKDGLSQHLQTEQVFWGGSRVLFSLGRDRGEGKGKEENKRKTKEEGGKSLGRRRCRQLTQRKKHDYKK